MRTRALVGVMAAAAMTALSASASAETYCVPAHAGCTGTSAATLTDAINSANAASNADDILLAPGVFTGGPNLIYETHVSGASRLTTVIDGGTSGYGLNLQHASSTVSDLTIHEPSGGPANGLYLRGSAERVTVDLRDNPVNGSTAVWLIGDGSFVDGAALNSLATTGADYGINVAGAGNALVSDVEAQGRYAITTDGTGDKTLRFARATGDIYGVQAKADDTLIDDSIFMGAPVVAYTGAGATGDILTTVRHATINGSYVGVEADAGFTAHMVVSNTAIVGGGPDPETPDAYVAAFGTSTGILDVDYGFFRSAHVIKGSGGGTETVTIGSHNIDGADAKLFDVAHNDLRPRFDSPLIDAGDPVPGGGEPMADLAGEFRAVNGRTDIGAYEYGRHTPTVSATASRAAVLVGEPVTFSADTNDEDPNEFPELTWVLDDGTTARGFSVTHAFATPGAHTATVTATDPVGLTATAPASVTVTAPILPRAALAPAFGFKKLKARKGVVRVRLSCPVVASDCAGRVELRLARKPKAKGLAAKTVVLGRAKYAIAHGTTRTIRVKLTKSARRRLRRARHGLNVKVVARPAGAAAKSRTVRLTGR